MALHTVRKEFSFDAAHRLVRGYDGKCAHLHGHTWRARFEISAPGLSAMGFVRDFSDFKVMKTWIDEHLDHACIVNSEDIELRGWLHKQGQRTFIMNSNPTSEELTKILFDVAVLHGLDVSAVEIDETCTSMARLER